MDNRFNEYLFKVQRVQNGMFMFMYPGIGSVIPVVYRDWKPGLQTTVVPPNTAPLFTASPSIPPLIFKSQIRFLLVLHDSQYRRFRNTAGFSPVPRAAVLGGLTVPS